MPQQLRALSAADVALIGVPTDHKSSFRRGPAKAPAAIRRTLSNGASNWSAECGVDLAASGRFHDCGDLRFDDNETGLLGLAEQVEPLLETGAKPLFLGGDHAISYPLVRALAGRYGPLDILHFDAHPDLYDDYEGDRYSHACPFARICEAGLARRLVQVGIRTLNDHQRAQVARYGVECHPLNDFDATDFDPQLAGPIYVSFDMDALDPAFAPGVSHVEPGGLSVREVLAILHRIDTTIVGADIVEYNPDRDVNDMTAAVAAKLVKEIAGQMLRER